MREDPDIIKILREEERLGLLTGQSQDTCEELATSEEVLEDMSDKNISVMKDAVEADMSLSKSMKEDEDILNAISDWICVLDREHHIIRSNSAVEKILGIPKSECMRQVCCKIVHRLDKPIPGCPLIKMLNSGQRESKEIQLSDSNRWVKVTVDPVKDEKGNITGAVHVVSDISERKQVEEKIQQQNEFLNNTIESLMHPFYVVDANDYTVKIANSAANLGRLSEKSTCYALTHQRNKPCGTKDHPCPLEEVKKNKKSAVVEHIHYDKKGNTRIVEVHAHPIFDDKGKVVQIIEYCLDITERKKAEEELKESKEKISNILASSPDSITITDLKGNIVNCNQETLKLMGFSSLEEAVGESVFPFITKKDRKRAVESTKKTLEEGITKNIEYNIVNKKEAALVIEVSTSVIKDSHGKLSGFVAITKDITERKKAEEKVKTLATMVNEAKVAISTVDMKGIISTWNKTCEEMLGYSAKEMIGKIPMSKICPKAGEQIQTTFKKGYCLDNELEYIAKDGRVIPCSTSTFLMKDDAGNPIGVGGIAIDITERKNAQEAIARLSKFPSENKNPVLRVAIDNTIIYANSASKPLLNIWDSEVGNPLPETLQSVTNDAINSKSTKEIEVPCGDIIYLLTITPVKDEDYVNIYGLDITERKKTEEKIEQQNIKLKKLDRIKTDFLNTTSHELRTPMAAIKGYIQMLLKQTLGDVTPEQKDALNVVLRNTDRLDHLVQDILDISRLESGTMKFIPEKTDISKMIKESLQTMQYNADIKNIKINTELEENIPTLIIDQERIKQVITNLVDNAIKFSPCDSTIMVRAKKDKTNVLFEVQDRGRGIPKNKQKKIFERFYQVDSGMDRKFGGVGLGLTISQGIIRSHGGDIWIDSTKGKGSIFKFCLPVSSVKDVEDQFKQMDIFDLENNK